MFGACTFTLTHFIAKTIFPEGMGGVQNSRGNSRGVWGGYFSGQKWKFQGGDNLILPFVNNQCYFFLSSKAAEKQGSAEETVQQLQTQVQDLQAELNRVSLLVAYL